MELYQLGSFIKEHRERRRISQEELSDGVCSVSTLSRIENGTQQPTIDMVKALYQKLGLLPPLQDVYASRSDVLRNNLEKKLIWKMGAGDFEIADLLEEYKSCDKSMNKMQEQTYLFFSAVYGAEHGAASEVTLSRLEEALHKTVPFTEQKSRRHTYYTHVELLILNNIAIEKHTCGRTKEAIKELEALKQYFENCIMDDEERVRHYVAILMNLVNWYDDEGKHEQALQLCDIGIQTCVKTGRLTYFPVFIVNKGVQQVRLGIVAEGKKNIEDALIIYKHMGNTQKIEAYANSVKEFLGIEVAVPV